MGGFMPPRYAFYDTSAYVTPKCNNNTNSIVGMHNSSSLSHFNSSMQLAAAAQNGKLFYIFFNFKSIVL